MGEHDDIDDHRFLYSASPALDGAGAGSYAPGADLPKVRVFLYANDNLVADLFHAPDSQFDFTEWESKYMLQPTFKTDFGDAFHPWDGPDNILEWDSDAESTFRPVVKDGDDTVIAHVGYILATDIAIPRASSIPGLSRSGRDVAQWKKYLAEQVNDYLAQGGIAYVAARPGDDVVWSGDQKWDMYHLKEDAFLVLVDPNGQVLRVLEVIEKRAKGVGTMALEFIGVTLDVLTIVDLAALGIRVSLIAARGARSGLKKILGLVLRGKAGRLASEEAVDAAAKAEIRDLTEAELKAARGGAPGDGPLMSAEELNKLVPQEKPGMGPKRKLTPDERAGVMKINNVLQKMKGLPDLDKQIAQMLKDLSKDGRKIFEQGLAEIAKKEKIAKLLKGLAAAGEAGEKKFWNELAEIAKQDKDIAKMLKDFGANKDGKKFMSDLAEFAKNVEKAPPWEFIKELTAKELEHGRLAQQGWMEIYVTPSGVGALNQMRVLFRKVGGTLEVRLMQMH